MPTLFAALALAQIGVGEPPPLTLSLSQVLGGKIPLSIPAEQAKKVMTRLMVELRQGRRFYAWTKGSRAQVDGTMHYIVYVENEGARYGLCLVRMDEVATLEALPAGARPMSLAVKTPKPTEPTAAPIVGLVDAAAVKFTAMSTALREYLKAHKGVFPYTRETGTVFGLLRSYAPSFEAMHDPRPGASVVFNANLAGASPTAVDAPVIPALIESVPVGEEFFVVYADGTVRRHLAADLKAVEAEAAKPHPAAKDVTPLPIGFLQNQVPTWLGGQAEK